VREHARARSAAGMDGQGFDRSLVEGLQRRDPAAWQMFVDKYLPILLARATRRLSLRARHMQDTCDIAQECCANSSWGWTGSNTGTRAHCRPTS